jgi:hypothetical protein
LTTDLRWLSRSTASGVRAADGGMARDYHEPADARLPFTADAAVQEDLRRADERQERAARNLVQSFAFGAPGVGGGHRHERGWRHSARESLLSRASAAGPGCPAARQRPGGAEGAAQCSCLLPVASLNTGSH